MFKLNNNTVETLIPPSNNVTVKVLQVIQNKANKDQLKQQFPHLTDLI